tara:strand:- start:99 stop:434 length:336 start_codon:yes stop_codon:yes gene_type:complete
MDYKKQEIQEYFDEWLEEQIIHQGGDWVLDNLDDLHHECFNTDYYIIGTQDAIEWMGDKAFSIIQFIKEYEEDNFGECSTPLDDPERVVNMYVYIIGEEVVADYVAEKEAA